MKLVILLLLAGIVASLGSGLFFLTRDSQGSTRVLTALKIRVALSILLVALLVVSFLMGWIQPPPAAS